MGDRSEEKQLTALRVSIAHADPGLHLTDGEIEETAQEGMVMLEYLDCIGAVDDSRMINILCDIYEPRLTMRIHGPQASTSPQGRYNFGKRVSTQDRSDSEDYTD